MLSPYDVSIPSQNEKKERSDWISFSRSERFWLSRLTRDKFVTTPAEHEDRPDATRDDDYW